MKPKVFKYTDISCHTYVESHSKYVITEISNRLNVCAHSTTP